MQTVPPPPVVVVAPGYVRSQFARCDSTTPFGCPGAPAREEDDVRDRSRRARAANGAGRLTGRDRVHERDAGEVGELGAPDRDARPSRAAAGPGRTRRRVAPRRTDARAFKGANTAPSFARAPNTGSASSEVSPHHSTRSPRPMPSDAKPFAMRFAAASNSPNVIASSSSVAAIASGAVRAACARISPINSMEAMLAPGVRDAQPCRVSIRQ